MTNLVGWEAGTSNVKIDALNKWAVGNTALDLGCGRGWYASALADRGFHVIGIDQTNRVTDSRIEMHVKPIRTPLLFEDNSFNTILMFDIIEHIEDEQGVMNEIARICSKGGRIIISVPNNDDAFLPEYSLTYLHRNDRTHIREYRLETIASHFESFGFKTLYCALQGQTHIPLVFSEFIRGPRLIKTFARYTITAMQKIGVLYNPRVGGDLHWVGERI
jgi:2-polyprenyl-3-methyl-5-hydroxy-6-metoxy-1,4-benzoquinol methylase